MSILSDNLSNPSAVGIIQLAIMTLIILPAIGYLFKQVSTLASAVATLTERLANTVLNSEHGLNEIKQDVKDIKNQGIRVAERNDKIDEK